METIQDINKLLARIVESDNPIIAVDGYPGVGKSELSRQISRRVNKQILELDKHRKDFDNFEDKAIEEISKNEFLIVEGVEAIKLCQNKIAVTRIYVDIVPYCQSSSTREIMKVGKECDWNKQVMLDYLNEEEEMLSNIDLKLDRRCIDYFVSYRPFEKADIFYLGDRQ